MRQEVLLVRAAVVYAAVLPATVWLLGRWERVRRRAEGLGLLPAARAGAGALRNRLEGSALAAWVPAVLSPPVLRTAAGLAAGAAAGLLLGGTAGVVGGGVVAALAVWLLPEPPGPEQRSRRRTEVALAGQLPLTADLLAACLAAGGGAESAAAAVSAAVGPPMAGRLSAVAAELRLGGEPAESWARFAEGAPALGPLGRCLERATLSGAPPAAALARLADARRTAAAAAAQARVRRAGVLATLPLGLCFLPAFVLTGVVPTVAGLAAGRFGRL
ncbi:type II secretion system F family protein [Phaeacidiphilus oryzae]|uniref:type II secretion system F family protein n=1 Tax=Phaeacidiphilus oryzae TaxID=348818 RepID=UPI00055A444E|nr:type II secretion system F family protein [Phaeacidiphilus oryzae]